MRIISLEEHFNTPELAHYSAAAEKNLDPEFWQHATVRLNDFADFRLADMDKRGVDVQVLSLTAPGIQAELDPVAAGRAARAANDRLATVVSDNPDRYAAFAALPMTDASEAATELKRMVTQFGFKGGLVNGHTGGRYLDGDEYEIFWETVAQLGVPIYLHPANSFDRWHVLSDHPELAGPAWGWGAEVASHALRLIFGGVFDRLPGVNIILGHMGEGLPYWTTRLDSRWAVVNKRGRHLDRRPSDYIRENVIVTTSGVCHVPALRCAIDTVGIDRVLFSADYPMEELGEAVDFLMTAPLTDEERAKIAHRNAESLLGL
jgi:2,3-dihydroxybenzoate decarboxylase